MGKKDLDRQLYDAVKANDKDKTVKFLAEGANPDAPVGKKGMTCMQRAAKLKTRDIETLLIQKGGTLHSSSSISRERAATIATANLTKQRTPTHLEAPPPSDAGAGDTGTMVVLRDKPPRSESPMASPQPIRMSRLAMGVRESFRKPSKASLVVEGEAHVTEPDKDDQVEPSEWSLPAEQLDEYGQKKWEFDRKRLQQVRKLGEGTFGIVFEGVAHGIIPGEAKTSVAVKMLSSKVEQAADDFFKEAKIMKAIGSKPNHIVRLLGLCTTEEPYLMIMELMKRGDLKTVLRDSRPKSNRPAPISYRRMALMGADICDGMSFLASMRIVHRDLAARNCLVDEDWTVKIGDFGLTRDVYSQEYYKMTGSAPLPIRWMAPESIQDGVYSTQSDLWSFGIVLWELVTFSKMPYAGLSNMEVCERVSEDGYRLPQPKGCPNEIYEIMQMAWQEEPEDRGSFADHCTTLRKAATSLSDEPISKAAFTSQARLAAMLDEGGDDSAPSTPTRSSPPTSPQQTPPSDRKDSAYYMYHEKEDRDNQKLYMDQSQKGLDSMSLAIERAKQAKEVQEIEVEAASKNVTVKGSATEEYASPSYGFFKQPSASSAADAETGVYDNQPSLAAKRASEEQERRQQMEEDAEVGVYDNQPSLAAKRASQQKEQGRKSQHDYDPMSFHSSAMSEYSAPQDTIRPPRQASKSESHAFKPKEAQAAAAAAGGGGGGGAKKAGPKYGGATSWVVGGAAPPVKLDLLHAKAAMHNKAAADDAQPDASAYTKEERPVPGRLSQAEAAQKAKQEAAAQEAAAQQAAAEQAETDDKLGTMPARKPIGPDDSFIPWRRNTNEVDMISAAEAAKDAFSLTNDFSSTANKARDAQAAILIQAEKETQKFLEAVIGDYLTDTTLQKSLKSGEVLCRAMNKISPGSIPNYHKNQKMAFKQMENIGRFLEACKSYGVLEKDLFVTVDLFENRNFKQVLNCVGALKNVAESKGFHTG